MVPAEVVTSLGMGLALVPLSSTALVGVHPHAPGWPAHWSTPSAGARIPALEVVDGTEGGPELGF